MQEKEHLVPQSWLAAYDGLIKIIFPVLLGMGGWGFNTLWDHQNRLVYMESTRYSKQDAQDDLINLQELSTQLRIQTGLIKGTLESNTSRMARVEQTMTNVVATLDSIERKLKDPR